MFISSASTHCYHQGEVGGNHHSSNINVINSLFLRDCKQAKTKLCQVQGRAIHIWIFITECWQAQPQLKSISISIKLRLALFTLDLPTHPLVTVVSRKVRPKASSRLPLDYCQAQFQLVVPVKSNFNWDLYHNHCETTHPPINLPRARIFEPLLDYLGNWNLAWKRYSTTLGQLAT